MLFLSVNSFAQKKYLHFRQYTPSKDNYYFTLSGDIPSDMKSYYSSTYGDNVDIGTMLNMLAERGFEIEFYNIVDSNAAFYILSRPAEDQASSIQHIKESDDDEIREVARYNLQGMPIGKNEKGIQIIVYSNYTTKTVIVE